MSDKAARKYFENVPYGMDSKSSEVHGKHNQLVINEFVENLVVKYDMLMANGDKKNANHFKEAVHDMSKQLDNLKSIKEEFALNYGGGVGGKNLFSNYTDLSFDKEFFTENGEILFDDKMQLLLVTKDSEGEDVVKRVEDVSENWVIRGTEENDFMQRQQSAVKQRNGLGEPLDFDVDWEVSNMLENEDAWKTFASDKIGGKYFLNDYVEENAEEIKSGQIPDDMLHPDSFNPAFDNRLHQYFSDRIRRAHDENYQTPKERAAAEELIAKSNSKNNTENNQA